MLNGPHPSSNQARTVAILNHRGERLADLRSGLQDLGWKVQTSRDLEASLELLSERKPAAGIVAPLTLRADNLEWERLLKELVDCAWLVLPWESAEAAVVTALFHNPKTTGDWLTVPYDAVSANARLNNLLNRREEMYAMAARSKELEEQLSIDDKTGLGNTRHFAGCLDREFDRTSRSKSPLTQIFMDIVGFKKVNTLAGHEFGDFVLKNIGNIIREALRTSDIPTRFGGDEFKILLPDSATQDAMRVVERLRNAFGRRPIEKDKNEFTVACYYGIATFSGHKQISRNQFNSQVDAALTNAKSLGANAISYWDHGKNCPMPLANPEAGDRPDEPEPEPEQQQSTKLVD